MLHTVVTMMAAFWALEDFRVVRSGRIQLSSVLSMLLQFILSFLLNFIRF
jgi:hypothetical protein